MKVELSYTVAVAMNAREASTMAVVARHAAGGTGDAVASVRTGAAAEVRDTAERFAACLDQITDIHHSIADVKERHGIEK